MNINKTNRKIIRELGNNARLSYKELAEKINSKKEIVAYHITKLEKEKIIAKYIPVFSQARLGIFVHKIYLRFQGLPAEKEIQLIEELRESPFVNWMARSVGTWDLMIALYCRNILEFAKRKNELVFKKYGQYIQDYSVSILEDALIYTRDYLINASTRDRSGLIYGGSLREEKIDESQRNIIRLIRNNGRYEATELARRLGLNVKTIITKINDLEQRKIIQGYIVIIDQKKLGLQYFKIDISFQDHSDEQYKRVLEYCKNNKYVVNLMKSVGDWEIELEAEAETVGEIYQLAKDLRTRFPTIIKKVDLHIITDEIKVDYLPAWY
ncbi:Lrp/AsnC family transcriptional regulator [Candidatus Woesearchaeota archaeon]|nr:Lrp/AsnC family transcriptional regulator [Candidatus Woesearchaeota archaeon]